MAAFADVNFEKVESKQMMKFLEWFVRNTTDKIFARMDRLDIGDTGALRHSIRGVVYTNAGGNDWLVRYYYLTYGRFIEMGLGHNRGSDIDLGNEGVKRRNSVIPPITSWQYGPIEQSFVGTTDSGRKVGAIGRGRRKDGDKIVEEPRERSKYHYAKPFLMNSIYAELARISFRMAERLMYAGVVNLTYGMIGTFDGELKGDKNYGALAEAMDKPWLVEQGWLNNFTYDVFVRDKESGNI